MRKPTLEQISSIKGNRCVTTYVWRDETFQIDDSARTAMTVRALLRSRDLDARIKSDAIVDAVFPCKAVLWLRSAEESGELLTDILWDAFGMDVTEGHIHTGEYEDTVFDFEEDAVRIKASLLLAYGIDWERAAATLPYADFMGLLLSLLETEQTTPFERAIFYRTSEPQKKRPKYSDYLEAFRSAQAHYALDKGDESTTADGQAHDMFNALKRLANGGA